MKNLLAILFVLLILVSAATAQETKIKWFGQAAFQITTPKGKVIMIDPWLKNPLNPEAKNGKNPVDAVTKCDYILLTHGHCGSRRRIGRDCEKNGRDFGD